MKARNFLSLFLITFLFLLGCNENENQDSTPPGNLTIESVTPTNGGGILTYSLPNDSDILFVRAEYTNSRGNDVYRVSSSHNNSIEIDGLNQKPGKLYITNERLIFEDSKNSSNNIYIQLSEIKSYKELKVFYKLTSGFDLVLDNGVHYCFNPFGGKSLLLKLEELRGSSIEKEVGVKHHLLPNIIFGLIVVFFSISPIISGVENLITIFDNPSKTESCNLYYDRNTNQYILLFNHVKNNPYCEKYTVFMDYEDNYGNVSWKPWSVVTDFSKEEYDEIRKYQYYSKNVPMSGFKFTPIDRK